MILRLQHGAVTVLTNSWTICAFNDSSIVISYLWRTLPAGETKRIKLPLTIESFNSRLVRDSNKTWIDLSDLNRIEENNNESV